MTATPIEAIATAAQQSTHGPAVGEGECLAMVRKCYDVAAKYATAADAWAHADDKHRTSSTTVIPAGVPVWWVGGTHGYGHVAISTGAGWCWSTDIKRVGYFDHVPITQIHDQWGLSLAGWSEDINDVRVWTAPKEPAKPKPPPRILLPTRVSRARALLTKALPHRTAAEQRLIREALATLPKR